MEFKAKRRKLKVTIDESVYEVKFPTLGELHSYRSELESSKNKEVAAGELLVKFLTNLGLPSTAQDALESPDLNEIVNLLTDQKKTE